MDIVTRRQESGQRYDLREAMNDIATTVEYMVNDHQYEGQED